MTEKYEPKPICPRCEAPQGMPDGVGEQIHCWTCSHSWEGPVLWGEDWAKLGELAKCPKCHSDSDTDHQISERRRCVACSQAFWPGDQGKAASTDDMARHAVPEKLARKAAEMSDKELGKAYVLNAIPALLNRTGSGGGVFWDLQCALFQESRRRGLKLKGELN